MFKTLNLYRLAADWQPSLEVMEAALDGARFTPCGATQDKSVGWIEPREVNGALVESVAGQRIMRLRIETKAVPGVAVRKKAQAEADHIEATTGRKPGKKQMKELREDATLALLPQAFPRQADVWVWFDLENRLMATDASSSGKSDEVITALVQALQDFTATMLQTSLTPQTAMTAWLSATDQEDVPGDFAVERACELKSGDEEKSVVRFNRHNLATDEIRKHIKEGKLPTWAAMSWNGRVGFVLSESMQLRKITFLEGVFDDMADGDASGFDADVTITTGEFRNLVPALVEALGGELAPSAALPDAPGSGVTIYSDGTPDELLEQARALVLAVNKASISYIQRKLQIGYNRAARLLEDLEKLGVVSPMHSSGQRDVLVKAGAA